MPRIAEIELSWCLLSERAEQKAARALAERNVALQKAARQISALQVEVTELRRLSVEASAPEVERLRARAADQHIAIEQLRGVLSRWTKYRRRFDGRLAVVLARAFGMAKPDAKSLVAEVWFLTVGKDDERVKEMHDWLSRDISTHPIMKAVDRGRISNDQADVIQATRVRRGRFRDRTGDVDEKYGALYAADDDIWDPERDGPDEPAGRSAERLLDNG